MDFIPQMIPSFDEKEAKACYEYMCSGGFVTEYKQSAEFERMLREFIGCKHAILVNNGTISLSLALLALGVAKDDEVIVPNLTMIATVNAVKLIGAIPIIVDVEPVAATIDLNEVKKHITSKTKAVVHVSLNTRVGHLLELQKFCKAAQIPLLEDSAQSLGSFLNGQHVGTFGDIGSISFSSPKIISTGQGGALITNDDDLARKINLLKNFGRESSGGDVYTDFGINCKFTDIQAVIGIEQMKKLPQRVKRIKEIWELYYTELKDTPNITIMPSLYEGWIPWFVDIYTDERSGLQKYLKENKIGSRPIYPPINEQHIYSQDPNTRDRTFPNTRHFSSTGLWLPSFTEITDEQIRYVCLKIKAYFT